MTDPQGMLVGIFRDDHIGDCTNGGVTGSKQGARGAIAIHPDLPKLFGPSLDTPGLKIIQNPAGTGYGLVAVPLVFIDGEVGPMFGGNFIWTSDSRFRKLSRKPIPVHDRFETVEQYERMSQ